MTVFSIQKQKAKPFGIIANQKTGMVGNGGSWLPL
jgi:hypothetical protein